MWGDPLSGALGNNQTLVVNSPVLVTATLASVSSPVLISASTSWTKVSLGVNTAAAINNLGELYTWGSNNVSGTLGDNTVLNTLTPKKLGSSSWTLASVGNNHMVAITSDFRLFTWGLNNSTQLGDNLTDNQSSPIQITATATGTVTSWIAASAGNAHTLAIDSTNILYAWGTSNSGQLGIVTDLYSWNQVALGYSHEIAIRSDNTLWGWGTGTTGQLGLNDALNRSSPTQIGTSSWTVVSANNLNSAAIRSDGALFTWGSGTNLQIGDGFAITRSSPVQIGSSSWIQVSVGNAHNLAIDAQGRLFGWGTATALNASTAPFSWTIVSENTSHTAAIRSDGLLFVWGLNTSGQIGNNNIISQSSPIQIGTSSWIAVSAGVNHTLGVTADFRLFAWGGNQNFNLGNNSTVNRSSPIQIGTGLSWTQVDAASSYSLAITSTNSLYAWGVGTAGQLGTLTEIKSWSTVSAGNSTSMGITADGRMFAWGLNTGFQIGDGSSITKSSPVQVGIPLSWSVVSSGVNHSLGITNTGALYGWGTAATGATGNFGELYSWNLVAGSGTNFYALRSDGSLWVTGQNTAGQLGLGDTIARSSPVQVGSSSYTFINAGGSQNAVSVTAITTDGKLFVWGYNGTGQLGDNSTFDKSSPIQLGAGNSYVFAATGPQTYAIRTDGTLWGTGFNANGRLGVGDVVWRSNLVQLGTSSWTQVSLGDAHVLALRSDSTLWAWGSGSANVLGNGTSIDRSSPTQVTLPGTGPWIAVAGGNLYSAAISGLGLGTPFSVYVWGANTSAAGLNTTVGNTATPTLMKAGAAGNSFIQVGTNGTSGASNPNTFFLSSNGQMWGCGDNTNGQLADNSNASKSSPVIVAAGVSFIQIPRSTPAFPIMGAIATNNTLWAWGQVQNYLTYNANQSILSSPAQVGGNVRWANYESPLYTVNSQPGQGSWTSVSAGNSFSLGIKNNLAYGWGQNSLGQTGTNQTLTTILSPTQIGTSSWSVVSSSETGNFAGGITSDNRLFMWGSGTTQAALPYNISNYSWTQISTGWSHIVGLKSDGSLWAWGSNAFGQLGDGTTITQSSPIQIGTSSWLFVSAGNYQCYAIRTDGTLWTWGYALNGSLGDNSIISKSNPTQIGTSSWAMVTANGAYGAYGILSNGGLYSWGQNDFGQLGITSVNAGGDIVNRSSPTLITSTVSWINVSAAGRFVAAIKTDNTLWSWGLGQNGQLGNNAIISRSSPVQVPGSWNQVVAIGDQFTANNAMAAIRTDATLWSWGVAVYLGQNDAINRSSPSQIGSSYWTQITSGGYSTQGFDAQRRLFIWGRNLSGALGLGDTLNRSSPTLLPAPVGTSWSLLTTSSNNPSSTVADQLNKAVASDGNLYVWGSNLYYGLGTLDTIDRSNPVQLAGNWVQAQALYSNSFLLPALPSYTSSPVQIGNSSWTQLSVGSSHSLAVRADGTLWSWGFNTNSQLGFSDTVTRSSPTQIGTSSWTSVSAGSDHSMAIKDDGTLWGWGDNTFGQVGLATTIYSWSQVLSRANSTIAIRNDGLLFTWGDNSSGELGLGDTINRSSPTQVGSFSWKAIGMNYAHAGAIRNDDSSLWMWGAGGSGRLGQNNTQSYSSPVQVFGGGSWSQVVLGNFYTLALRTNGVGYAWGNNGSLATTGWLGTGDGITRSQPTIIAGGHSWTQLATIMGLTGTSDGQSYGIRTDGILMTWGYAPNGLGGGAASTTSPLLIPGFTTTTWNGVYAGYQTVFAITTAGVLYVWGLNSNVVAGTNAGSTGQYNTPTLVAIPTTVSSVAASESHAIAIASDGTLWGWGAPIAGTLLSFSNATRSSPTQIDSGSWSQVSTGINQVSAIQQNKIFTWGASSSGQGGTGFTFNRSSTTQLGGNPDINTLSPVQISTSSWSQVNAGNQFTLARDTNNILYAWGQDTSGQLGL
jgi:alpha-tubulin suppressor-like RCC1 family protein